MIVDEILESLLSIYFDGIQFSQYGLGNSIEFAAWRSSEINACFNLSNRPLSRSKLPLFELSLALSFDYFVDHFLALEILGTLNHLMKNYVLWQRRPFPFRSYRGQSPSLCRFGSYRNQVRYLTVNTLYRSFLFNLKVIVQSWNYFTLVPQSPIWLRSNGL